MTSTPGQNGRTLDLQGIFIPAVTPFDRVTGELDAEALKRNVDRWMRTPVRGIAIGGSTGEAVLLDPEERIAALSAARESVRSDRLLLAGTGVESTRLTLRLSRSAAEAGADAVLVQPPAFYRGAMDSRALLDHYQAVADGSPIPVILYQVPPRFSTVELVTGLIVELSSHPNVIGVKDSRGDLDALGDLLTHCRDGFQVLMGEAGRLFGAIELGATGGILAIANFAAEPVCELFHAAREGRTAEAGRLQERILPLGREIPGRHGVAGVKAALDARGFTGGDPRPPLRPLDAAGRSEVEKVLEAAGLLDTPEGPV